MRDRRLTARWTATLAVAGWLGAIAVAETSASVGVDVGVAIGLAVAGGLAFIAFLVSSSLCATLLGVRGRVVEDGFGGRWVQILRVHPAFAQALARDLRTRSPGR